MFPFVGVSDCFVCLTAYHEHVFLVFCLKRVLYTGVFKVWCLGNNFREKYAFTFIQRSRSMYWLISTQGYNPEASKFPLLLGRFHGNDPSYKMGRVCFSSGTNRPLAPLTRAQDIRVCCVKWVSVRNHTEHRAHGCLRCGEQRHLYSVYSKRWRANGSVPSEIDYKLF